jgi:hypothetical protein
VNTVVAGTSAGDNILRALLGALGACEIQAISKLVESIIIESRELAVCGQLLKTRVR